MISPWAANSFYILSEGEAMFYDRRDAHYPRVIVRLSDRLLSIIMSVLAHADDSLRLCCSLMALDGLIRFGVDILSGLNVPNILYVG